MHASSSLSSALRSVLSCANCALSSATQHQPHRKRTARARRRWRERLAKERRRTLSTLRLGCSCFRLLLLNHGPGRENSKTLSADTHTGGTRAQSAEPWRRATHIPVLPPGIVASRSALWSRPPADIPEHAISRRRRSGTQLRSRSDRPTTAAPCVCEPVAREVGGGSGVSHMCSSRYSVSRRTASGSRRP